MVIENSTNGSTGTYTKKPKTFFRKNNSKSVSRTKQSFKDECDINCIMAKVNRHMINHRLNPKKPVYGDFSNIPDYAEMLNTVHRVRNSFNSLPAKIRAKFENDPEKLVAYMDDPNNLEEARELGLAPKDLSKVKYVRELPDGTLEDVTDEVFEKRGFFIDGKRVNRDGTPYIKNTPDETVSTPDPPETVPESETT